MLNKTGIYLEQAEAEMTRIQKYKNENDKKETYLKNEGKCGKNRVRRRA